MKDTSVRVNSRLRWVSGLRWARLTLAAGISVGLGVTLTPVSLGAISQNTVNTSIKATQDPSYSPQPSATPAPKTFEITPPHDRSETTARNDFERIWTATNQTVPFSQNTVISTCTPGSPNPEATNRMLGIWNYTRALNGLEPVQIHADSPAAQPAQAAALTAAIGPVASSNPGAVKGAACVTPDVQLASGAGVIARLDGIVTPATEILRYITEASLDNVNDNLGHRLELFAPQQAYTTIGAVSIGTSGPCASSIQLFDESYRTAKRPLSPSLWRQNAVTPKHLAWPSPGFFPTRLLPTGAKEDISRWSFSAQCADLRQATVSVTDPKGNAVPLEVIHREEPGSDVNKTPWEYAGYDTVLFKIPLSHLEIPQFYDQSEYRVKISGIQTASGCMPQPADVSYNVKLFNSSWPADPQGDADSDGVPNFKDAHPLIPDLTTSRLAGANRIETAARIALEMPYKATKVYLARSDLLVDALVGGSLKDGPVLLLSPHETAIPPIVTQVVNTLNPSEVVALGGTKAVSNQKLFAIASGRKATRLGGSNRIQTSLMIARRVGNGANSLYLTQAYTPQGKASPDALTGATLPDGPITLVNSSVPTIATIRQLAADLQVKRIVALGGSRAVPEKVLQNIAIGRPATRLAGADRYETSLEIALESSRLHPTNRVYLARGDVFADAVAGTKLQNGSILLVPPECKPLQPEVLKVLSTLRAFQITALGGQNAVCESNLEATKEWPDVVNETVTDF